LIRQSPPPWRPDTAGAAEFGPSDPQTLDLRRTDHLDLEHVLRNSFGLQPIK
jgi:hypothetical protein